jgi:putative flippase GtrA
MVEKIKMLVVKYQDMILYVFFGALATLVNTASYYLCYNILGVSNVPSVVIAWLLAVIFAFFTNKLWVFRSKSFAPDVLKHEIPTFFGARLLTGLMDLGIMYVAVDVLHGNGTVWKLISNVLVIILNYVASKLIIFKPGDSDQSSS